MSVITKLSGSGSTASVLTTTQAGVGGVDTTRQSLKFALYNSDSEQLNVTFELVRTGEHHEVFTPGGEVYVTLEVTE